ncbi:MAG TPA: NifU family protein [Gaiellales bacterium]|nr:NifU family protein [Gaiellales bacterium]
MEPVLTVTPEALEKVELVRGREPDPAALALWVEVTGRDQLGRFQYDLWLAPDGDAPQGSAVERAGELTVVIPPASVEVLRGAVLNRSGDLETGGLVIEESAQASPDLGPPPEHLTGDTAQRVQQVLERQINPAIAAHGGVVHLVNVEDGVAFVRMGGGCAGCGMAGVTLDQGIELAIRQAVPEITGIVDVTDHAAGQNPYYVPTA